LFLRTYVHGLLGGSQKDRDEPVLHDQNRFVKSLGQFGFAKLPCAISQRNYAQETDFVHIPIYLWAEHLPECIYNLSFIRNYKVKWGHFFENLRPDS
jgi:hypothetical protein